jgi:alkylation response protein AidB-like acyl-CoA dehydrogenase
MQFVFAPEEEAFRTQLRSFLQEELPLEKQFGDLESPKRDDEFGFYFTKQCAKRGWLVPHWPREYGGLGATYMQQLIFNEEMAYHRAPLTGSGNGTSLIGPILMLYGTDEQKAEHLPGIARAEVCWAQGFSEPGSGSDLASLQTSGVIEGDEFIINGGKIWTSSAQYASMAFVLCRTDPEAPKHRGISFVLVDMKQPGYEVRPLIDMAGRHIFNQMFFDNVRAPRKNLVGELNRGWYVAMATFSFERSGIFWPAAGRRTLEDLVEYCKQADFSGRKPLDDALTRQKLAELKIENDIAHLLAYRVTWKQAKGELPDSEAAMTKVFATEHNQRLYRGGSEILGMYTNLRWDNEKYRLLHGRIQRGFLVQPSNTIDSGTSEIMRNVIATRGLGLPRI